MNYLRFRRGIAVIAFALLPLLVSAQTQPKIITFGADLTADQRAALTQRFGATEGTDTILTVTTDEMRAAMQTIIPVPDGYTSVSSTALTCAAPDSGLQVSTENITKVTAAMYAAALVTAGVGDAELIVAAPADAQAEGMTALTGLFKGLASGGCGRGTLDTTRRDLAYRQLAVTADLAQSTGSDLNQASDLMLRAQQNLIHAGNNPDAAVPSAESAQRDTGVTLPKAQADALVQLLADMGQAKIDWGTYAGGWTIQQLSPNAVRVNATTSAVAAVAATGQQLSAIVTSSNPLRFTGIGIPSKLAVDPTTFTVVRNDQPAKLSDLQLQDRVTITLDAQQRVQRIDAHSASSAATGQTVQGVVTQNANNTLSMTTANGVQAVGIPQGAVHIRRNGQPAQLDAIQRGDTVTAQLDAQGRVTLIEATGTQTGLISWLRDVSPLWVLLPLLLLAGLLVWRKRRAEATNEVVLVGPKRSTVIDTDGTRQVVDNDRMT